MNLLDSEVIESCRERNGRQKAERASRIDNALSRPKHGYRNGQSVVEGYENYPSRNDLSQPQQKDFLCNLFSHYYVTSYDDAATEMTNGGRVQHRKWADGLEKAANLFNIDADALFDKGEAPEESRLEVILEESPSNHVINPPTPTLIGEMYALGLGISEIEEILSDYDDSMTEETVRNSLKRCGLLGGKPTESNTKRGSVPLAEDDLRLGGTTISTEDGDTTSDDTDIIVR